MRHKVKGSKLNRDVGHRRSLYKNLVSALIKHGSIETTEAKAKSIRALMDKLMTKAKKGGVHNRRLIDQVLNQTTLVNKLVDVMAPKTGKRSSGFTRIIKLGQRRGDDTMMTKVEFVDQMEEVKVVKEVAAAPKAEKEAKPKATATKKPRITVKPEVNVKAKGTTKQAVNQPTRTQPKRSV